MNNYRIDIADESETRWIDSELNANDLANTLNISGDFVIVDTRTGLEYSIAE